MLIDEQGSIVTNAHVVDGAANITVTLHDGTRLPAELIGSDPQTDVALLQVTLPKGPHVPAHLGDSDKLEIGQKVLAIGHPFGLGLCLFDGHRERIRATAGVPDRKCSKSESFRRRPLSTPAIAAGRWSIPRTV